MASGLGAGQLGEQLLGLSDEISLSPDLSYNLPALRQVLKPVQLVEIALPDPSGTPSFSDDGGEDTADLSNWTATAGDATSSTSQFHGGARAVKLNTGDPAVLASVYKGGILADAGRRISVWFNADYLGLVFQPTDIPGLVLWLEADAGLYTDAAKTVPAVNDGDAVYTWADQSGNGKDVVQTTLSKRPLLKLAIQNGKPVVRFDGTDDWLKTTALTVTQPTTLFAVAIRRGAGNIYAIDCASTGNALIIASVGNGSWDAYSGVLLTKAVSNNTNVPYAVDVVYNGASSILVTNGVTTSGPAGSNNGNGTVVIGAYGGLTAPLWNGDIAEVLIYNSALSTADRQAVESYLNEKYAIY
jgi:hypothetical protein